MIDFDTYIKMGEPGGKERAEAKAPKMHSNAKYKRNWA